MPRYNIARISAVKGAEGVMSSVTDQYGWAWVNKKDPSIYYPVAVQYLAGADQDHRRVLCDHPVADQEKGCQIAMKKKLSCLSQLDPADRSGVWMWRLRHF